MTSKFLCARAPGALRPFIVILALTPAPAVAAVPPPRSLEAIAESPSLIRIYWLAAANAEEYRVRRDGQVIATLPAGTTRYDDAGLEPNSTHSYSVTALASGHESAEREYTERTYPEFPQVIGASRLSRSRASLPVVDYDVVVIQASSSGVAAAVESARRGFRTALIEPTNRLGGLPANGLSATDMRRPEHASGFFVRFRDTVQKLYAREGIRLNGMAYEPRIAQQAMKTLLYHVPNLDIYRRARLAAVLTTHIRVSGAQVPALGERPDVPQNMPMVMPEERKAPGRIRVDAVKIQELNSNGAPTGRCALFRAREFVDATDCGDLAAWAGAPFRLGRESRTPAEPHAGVIYYDRAHDRLLRGSTGRGDRRIQSYAYLLTVKDYGPGADRTIPPPPGYSAAEFTHSPAWRDSWAATSGRMPGDKYELNQHPQGNDLQAINYRYPVDGYPQRARIEDLYRNHVLGYLYYIQTQLGKKTLGLPDDEYRDTGGFPPLLYVREGRRILGEELPLERDITNGATIDRPESIGIGDYPMDSHAVRPKMHWERPDMGEGEWWLYRYTPVHQLPLGILVPRRLDNVFVTMAVSSTHVSFGTYRLEPVRMEFGEAAGVAAGIAIRYALTARDVPARQVQDELLPHIANAFGDPNLMLTYLSDVPFDSPHYRAIQYMVVRGYRFGGDRLRPDAPTTRGELARMLVLLARRAPVGADPWARLDAPAISRLDPSAGPRLAQRPGQDQPLTRAQVARWLVAALGVEHVGATARPAGHYADTGDARVAADAEALYSIGIDSALWDGWSAYAPGGELYFRPDGFVTHAQLLAALYLAQLGIGPLFRDPPCDRLNYSPEVY